MGTLPLIVKIKCTAERYNYIVLHKQLSFIGFVKNSIFKIIKQTKKNLNSKKIK